MEAVRPVGSRDGFAPLPRGGSPNFANVEKKRDGVWDGPNWYRGMVSQAQKCENTRFLKRDAVYRSRSLLEIISSSQPPPTYNEALNDLPPEYPVFPSIDPTKHPSAPARITWKIEETKPSSPLLIDPTFGISIDLTAPSGVREHAKKKKNGPKKAAPAAQPEKKDDKQDQAADEGNGDAGKEDGGEGDGNNDGGGAGGGDGGGDDWTGWNFTGNKKKAQKQKEEEERKRKEEEEEQRRREEEEMKQKEEDEQKAKEEEEQNAASRPSGNFDLGNPWSGFAPASRQKAKKKGKGGSGPAATTDDAPSDNKDALQDVNLDESKPPLDFNFGSSNANKQESGFSLANWGLNMAKGLGSLVSNGVDDNAKSSVADNKDSNNNPWSTDANNKKDAIDDTDANAAEEKPTEDTDIWAGSGTIKNEQRKNNKITTPLDDPSKNSKADPQPVAPKPNGVPTDNPWARLSKKEQRKAKKTNKVEPILEPAPLVDLDTTEGQTKDENAWDSIDLSPKDNKEPPEDGVETDAGATSKENKKDASSWADDLLGEDPAPAAEPSAAAKAEPKTNDGWFNLLSSGKKNKKGKKKDEPVPEPEPKLEPEQENKEAEDPAGGTTAPAAEPEKGPAVDTQDSVKEPAPPALPESPLYANWASLSSKVRKNREKLLKKKGLPIPDSDGNLPRPEPIPEASNEPAPETEQEPASRGDPEPEIEQGKAPEEPVTAPAPEPPNEEADDKNNDNDNSWGIWNPFRDTKKKSKGGKFVEGIQNPLPPPAPTPPPALGQQLAEDDEVGESLDVVDNTTSAKSTKKSKSNTDKSSKLKDFAEEHESPAAEDPPAKEPPVEEAPAKEAPAKSGKGFWASLGVASMGKPAKTATKSKPEEKVKTSDVKSKNDETKDAKVDDFLVDVNDDTKHNEEPSPAAAPDEPAAPTAKPLGDPSSKSKTATGKLSVLERVKALELEKATEGKVPEKPAEPIETKKEIASPKKASKTKPSSKNASSKREPETDTLPKPAEEEERSPEMLPGSFPDELEPAPSPEHEKDHKPKPESKLEPEAKPVKTKKTKKVSTNNTSTATRKPTAPETKAKKPELSLEPEKPAKKESGEKTSREAISTGKAERPSAETEQKSFEDAAGMAEKSPPAEMSGANPDAQPRSAEPGKSTKNERTRTQRTPISTSWGFWGPVPPKPPTSQAKLKYDTATTPKKPEQQRKRLSNSDKDARKEVKPATHNRVRINDLIVGGAPPSRSKSTRKTEHTTARTMPRTERKTVSRRPSVDRDDIEPPSRAVRDENVTTDRAAKAPPADDSRRERSRSHRRVASAPNGEDNLDSRFREKGPKEPTDFRRGSRRTQRPRSYFDEANAGQARRAPDTSPERDDDLAYGEIPRPRITRSKTVPKRPEAGGLLGLFDTIRRATRPEPTAEPRRFRDDDLKYMTDPEREDRSRRRRSRRPDVEDTGYATDSRPAGGSQRSEEEEEEARRAARRARRASRHAALEQARERELREAEERRRRRDKEREREARKARETREARERRAREEAEREERRREEKRARRAALEERQAREEEAREAAAQAEAREAKRRERERERRRLEEEERREALRRESSKSKRRSAQLEDDHYSADDNGRGFERRHRSRPPADERAKSQRRKSRALHEAAENPPIPLGKKEKIDKWVHAQADDPPEPPPVSKTVVEDPPSSGSPHTQLPDSDEEARLRMRRQRRMRTKYPGLTEDEIRDQRHRARSRSRRDGVRTSSRSGDHERDRSRSRRALDRFGYPLESTGPRLPNWLRKLTR